MGRLTVDDLKQEVRRDRPRPHITLLSYLRLNTGAAVFQMRPMKISVTPSTPKRIRCEETRAIHDVGPAAEQRAEKLRVLGVNDAEMAGCGRDCGTDCRALPRFFSWWSCLTFELGGRR